MSRKRRTTGSIDYARLKTQVEAGSKPAARELLKYAVKRDDGETAILCVDVMFDRALLLVEILQGVELEHAKRIANAAMKWANGERAALAAWAGTFTVRYVSRPKAGTVQLKPIFKLVPDGAPPVFDDADDQAGVDAIKKLFESEAKEQLEETQEIEVEEKPPAEEEPWLPFEGYEEMSAWEVVADISRRANPSVEYLSNVLAYEKISQKRIPIISFVQELAKN